MDLQSSRWSSVPRPARAVLALYGVLSVADIALSDAGVKVGDWATKPLLMPVLALAAVLAARALGTSGTRLPVVGMLLGGAGDAALIGHGTFFLVGMGCFAAGHVCYLVTAKRRGAFARLDRRFVGAYAVVWGVLLSTTWSGLGALRVPVAVYGALLVTMALGVSALGRWPAIGGALFVVSDGTLALDLAKVSVFPHQWILVMPTYVVAQLLLAAGWSGLAGSPGPGPDPDPRGVRIAVGATAETSG